MSLAEVEPATGARERLAAFALRAGLKLAVRPALSPAIPIPCQRRWLKNVSRLTRPDAAIEAGVLDGIAGEWLRPPGIAEHGTILYLHGGGYCAGSPATHRSVTAHLAAAAGLAVFAAGYRLAPEHPFPAALDDAVAAARALGGRGPFAIAGNSAGGGLALAATLALRERMAAAPAALVLFSPWVDLTLSWPADPIRGEAMISRRWLEACARHYLAGADPNAPLASPVRADLRGLPPTLIQAGRDELLRHDAVSLHDALERAGVAVRCEIVRSRWHAFQLHAGMLPSADAAVGRAAEFIRRALVRTSDRPG